MTTRFREALAARTAGRKSGDAGFTLIELLVVVLIIGILAAIAIPVFLNQQNSAKDGAAKSDLGNAKTAYLSYLTDHPDATAAGAITTALLTSDEGFVVSSNVTSVTVKPSSAGSTFCIDAVSSSGKLFSITNNGGVVNSACA